MLTCKEVGELSSQRLELPVGFWKRLKMFLHCRVCKSCRTSDRNMDVIRDAVRRANVEAEDCDGLADCSKKRMKALIEAAMAPTAADASAAADSPIDVKST